MEKKLYRVTLRGMKSAICGGICYGVAYVVAEDAQEAYRRVRSTLDQEDVGFSSDRALEKVELVAEAGRYPECGTRLYA